MTYEDDFFGKDFTIDPHDAELLLDGDGTSQVSRDFKRGVAGRLNVLRVRRASPFKHDRDEMDELVEKQRAAFRANPANVIPGAEKISGEYIERPSELHRKIGSSAKR